MHKSNAFDAVLAELREAVRSGAPGTRLPSVRELMARHRASPATVQRAVSRLTEEGLVEPHPGRGTFVAARAPLRSTKDSPPDLDWQAAVLGDRGDETDSLHRHLRLPPPDAISLASGYPDESLQASALLARAMTRAARRPDSWGRVPTEGVERLRAWFALQAGGLVRAHDVVITPGAQAGLATIMRALVPVGTPVLLESPTYIGAIAAARAAGRKIIPVPIDADGVRPDLLADTLARSGARLFVCQPLAANPTGASLATERRAAVMDAIHRAKAFLIEDDYARDLILEGTPAQPLVADDHDGHVIYLRSLTKATAPGLRVAAMIARGAAGARIRSARVVDDFFVAGSMQEAALDVISSPAFVRHRKAMVTTLRERRDIMVAAVHRMIPQVAVDTPSGGLGIWLALPSGVDDLVVSTEAARAGVVVSPGRAWFPGEPPGAFLRLSFAGVPTAEIVRGVAILAEVMHQVKG